VVFSAGRVGFAFPVGRSVGRSAGRAVEVFVTFPFGRALPFVGASVRGALGAEPRRSSSAFRFDAAGAPFVEVDEDEDFSPVIDASKSEIGMVAVVPVE